MAERTVTAEDIQSLGAKLNELDGTLSTHERELLLAVLALAKAGMQGESEDEVSGYLLLPAVQPSLTVAPAGSLGAAWIDCFSYVRKAGGADAFIPGPPI